MIEFWPSKEKHLGNSVVDYPRQKMDSIHHLIVTFVHIQGWTGNLAYRAFSW